MKTADVASPRMDTAITIRSRLRPSMAPRQKRREAPAAMTWAWVRSQLGSPGSSR